MKLLVVVFLPLSAALSTRLSSLVFLKQEVDLEDYVNRPEKISAADISAIAQEAGLQAVRKNRYVVLGKDFDTAYKKHINKHDKEHAFYTM